MTLQTPDPAAEDTSAAGSSRPAKDLVAATQQLLGGSRHLDGAALRDALLDLHEFWLTTKATEIGITPASGFAIVATGGLGRRELLPYSDLDLMLLHDEMPAEKVSSTADRLWYPLWDANIRIDHSVRTVSEALLLGASVVSLVAVGYSLVDAGHAAAGHRVALTALTVGSVVLAWATVHTVYALRYARLFHAAPVGGISFHSEEPPDYVDFAYVAVTIGMTYQVSDTDISKRPIRRAAIHHALLSYLFGAVILGITVSSIATILGS